MEKIRSHNWWNVTAKKYKKQNKFLLLFLLCFSLLAWGDDDPLACVRVIARILPTESILRATDEATLLLENNEKREVRFLGNVDHRFYFWDSKTGFFLHVAENKARVTPEFSNTPLGKRQIQEVKITCQVGGSCAAFSTLNGIERTNELGFLLHALKEAKEFYDPVAMLAEVQHDEMNFVFRARFRLGTRYDPPKQVLFQQNYLRKKGLTAGLTTRMRDVDAHLAKGLPAILNLRVKWDEPTKFQEIIPGGVLLKPTDGPEFFKPDPHGEVGSGHSVLAVGLLQNTRKDKKILIADSAFGNLALWDYNETARALWEAVLIGPHKK